MANHYDSYPKSIGKQVPEKQVGKYKQKFNYIKTLIREYVHENAALVDENEEIQVDILIRKEERKFLLRKLCEHEPQVALEVQHNAKRSDPSSSGTTESKKKRHNNSSNSKRPSAVGGDKKIHRTKKLYAKSRKRIIQPIPLDNTGRPIFPIDLGGRLTIHSIGEVVPNRSEFHTESVVYPIGFVSTRIYGSLKDPTVQCVYTCTISDINDMPRFEIASDDSTAPITGDTPDVCHSLLLQRINDSISLNVVSTRPRGNDFFGLSHPVVLNLIQSSPGTRRCPNYRWTKFEVSKNAENYQEGNDAGLSYDYLQRSISFCRYKMAPDVLQKPEGFLEASKKVDKKIVHEFY